MIQNYFKTAFRNLKKNKINGSLNAASTIFIGLVTISLQAIKATLSNPVKSLRTE